MKSPNYPNMWLAKLKPVIKVSVSGVLVHKWHLRDIPADEEWTVVHQIVISKSTGHILE